MTGTARLLERLPREVTGRLPGKLGDRADRSVVSVVRLQGVISPAMGPMARSVINLPAVESALSRAFEMDNLAAVALVINSPGGSATQSALVADRIRGLAAEHGEKAAEKAGSNGAKGSGTPVPVLAFCEDVAASGGYWLACAADEIYAHPTSLVGSIGVVSHGFGLVGLLDKIGVERRVHSAGEQKVRLDPFRPEKADDVAWLTGMQGELHELFRDWVRERRGATLTGSDEQLFTGEVWTGAKAQALGLVDGLGTPREVLARRFPDAEPVQVEGRKPLLARLGLGVDARRPGGSVAGGLVEDALRAVEVRAAWARYGL